jgi:hypothetical protein
MTPYLKYALAKGLIDYKIMTKSEAHEIMKKMSETPAPTCQPAGFHCVSPDPLKQIRELDKEIARLTEERNTQKKRATSRVSKESLTAHASLIHLSYVGRCGLSQSYPAERYLTCSMQTHIEQLSNPLSWVHSAFNTWVDYAIKNGAE